MADEDPPVPSPDQETSAPPEESETRTRLAEAQLEQAMDGYHTLRAENEALRAQIVELHEKQRSVTQDLGASLERQKRAVARELKSERETIYARYIEILDNFDRAFDTGEARAASHSLMEGFILVRNQVVQVLRDGGFDVVAGVRKGGKGWKHASEDKIATAEPGDAVDGADLVALLAPDMAQAELWSQTIEPRVAKGATILFAHGFSIHYGRVNPRADQDVVLVAPKGPGDLVRKEYARGRGVPALFAVYQNATGKARCSSRPARPCPVDCCEGGDQSRR